MDTLYRLYDTVMQGAVAGLVAFYETMRVGDAGLAQWCARRGLPMIGGSVLLTTAIAGWVLFGVTVLIRWVEQTY